MPPQVPTLLAIPPPQRSACLRPRALLQPLKGVHLRRLVLYYPSLVRALLLQESIPYPLLLQTLLKEERWRHLRRLLRITIRIMRIVNRMEVLSSGFPMSLWRVR
uniref:Uncharacterized protein n=1 Tax=Plectus sambesii TaxID=2011161 RepID=A0A914UVB4_9BILA